MGAVRSFIIEDEDYPARDLGSYRINNNAEYGVTEAGVYVLTYEDGDSFTHTLAGATGQSYAESTSANEDENGRTFICGSTVSYSATSSGSYKTELFNGFTSTSTNSGSAEYTLSTRVSNISDYGNSSYVNRSTIGTDTYSGAGVLTQQLQTLGPFTVYATATMIGAVEDGSYTGITTRTNMTTVRGESWFTTAQNSKRITTSSTCPHPVTITDTIKYTSHYFSQGIVDTISMSEFTVGTKEGPQGKGYLSFNLLETANHNYEQGVFAWVYDQAQGDDGMPGKQGPQEDFYVLKTVQGDRWKNYATTSAAVAQRVQNEDDVGETETVAFTTGVGIGALTYHVTPTSTATLAAQKAESPYTIARGVVLSTYSTIANAATVATVPMLSFVSKDNAYTTFVGKITIPLVTKATEVSIATGLWDGAPNGSGSGSSSLEANGITTNYTYSASDAASAGAITNYGRVEYGVHIVPGAAVGGVGKLKTAAGFVGFGNTSLNLSAQKSFWRTSSYTGVSTDSRFTAGDTGSLLLTYLPQFFTERMGPHQTILDLNDKCQSTRTFAVYPEGKEMTVTTVVTQSTGAVLTTKAVSFDTEGNEGTGTATSRVAAWKTETTTISSTHSGSVSYKWLPQPTSKSAMTSRAIAMTVRDEKLQEVRGTRTVVLDNGVKADKGGWEALPTVAIGSTGMINGALYAEAILTWCHAVVDMTVTDSRGKTSTLQKSQGNGNKVYTFNLEGRGVIAHPRPVAWAGIGGNGYATAPFFPKGEGQSPVVVGRMEEETV